MSKFTISTHEAGKVVQDLFGLHVSRMEQLGGYVDKNFLVEGESGKEYLLKLQMQRHYPVLDKLMDEMLQHLQESSFKVPSVVPSVKGKKHSMKRLAGKEGEDLLIPIHLVSYIPGETIINSKLNAAELVIVSHNVGKFGGLMQERLMELQSNFKDFRRSDVLMLYPENFPLMSNYVHRIRDLELKEIVSNYIDEFERKIIPQLPNLRKGYVHGDYSNTNIILIDRERILSRIDLTKEELLEYMGTIDFEYAHYGYLAFNLSVCLAYMMTEAVNCEADPLEVAARILSGYQENFPLTDYELQTLFMGVVARLCTSYVLSLHTLAENEDSDEEYVTCQARRCPGLLKMLWKYGEAKINRAWLNRTSI